MAPVKKVCHRCVRHPAHGQGSTPRKKNNLNALCDRYGVDNSHRTLHGALLDAEILAEVYLAMTRGQESLIMDLGDDKTNGIDAAGILQPRRQRRAQQVRRASQEELILCTSSY
jgi:DNA polymerase-3 subunit epsilon